MELLDRAILLLLLERPMGKTELLDTIYETPPKHERQKLWRGIDYQLMLMEKEGLIRRNREKKYEPADLKYGYGILQIAMSDGTMETLEVGKTADENRTQKIIAQE